MWTIVLTFAAAVFALASCGGQVYENWQQGRDAEPSLDHRPGPTHNEQVPPS